jgi:hypothetical protein
MEWTIGKAFPAEVERAANAFNAYAAQAEDAPHRWGEEQEVELEKLASELLRLYDVHGVADIDRIVGI